MFRVDCCTCGGLFDIDEKERRLRELEASMGMACFWEDPDRARTVIAESNRLQGWTLPCRELKKRIDDLQTLFPEVEALGDPLFMEELLVQLSDIEQQLSELEIRRMLSGEMDDNNCYLTINSGAGGTEACDWASMLARMYQRWAAKRGWSVEILDTVEGDVAGMKSMTMKICGSFAYGYAKAERGVHRLVRISPFDANSKRHTSFASVDVTPEIVDEGVITVRDEDLRIDTYRASGAGGQHVNKTDSAVRITHVPTGIVVSCQRERSQLQNRETCRKLLLSQLYERQLAEKKAKIEGLSGEKTDIGWGHHIRSYVLQPYTLVKDVRTQYQEGNVESVMDGAIDGFVYAYLTSLG